jgi:molybdopterin converting factor small subunit
MTRFGERAVMGHYGHVVTVRYFAAARAAAGVAEERADAPTLGALVSGLSATRGDRLATVLGAASFLVDGLAWHDRETALPPGATVDVLPPFAGG